MSVKQGGAPALDSRSFQRSGGIAFMVSALLCFGALDTTTKFASATAPLVMALWLRYGVQTVATTAVLWPSRGPRLFVTRRPVLQFVRGLLLLPLVLVAANTGFQALTSRMARTEDPGTMHVYTGLVGLVVTSAALPLAWQALPWQIWVAIGLMGVFSTLGPFLLIIAFTRTPVAVLTPYLYLQIAFATLGGWLVFSHVPDDWSLAGIALIAVGGVFGTWLTGREALARKRLESPESTSAAIAGADAN